ncbi:MAG: hypothetical protein JXJ20_08010 [Anaerolineae bacterium]|nr:hypothetical protein [Anaerolineae bacterium]
MARVWIPQPTSGGVILSYKCQARCRHCIYACSPEWKADFISEADLETGLAQLSGKIRPSPWGARTVSLNGGLHFSGGEPFLNFDLLLRAVEIADSYHIPSTFVETNSAWCIDDDSTHDKLQCLHHAGLKGIMISVNPFYAEYVPFEHTERCIRVSQRVFGAQNVMVYQVEYYRQFLEMGIQDTLSLEEYARLARGKSFLGHVELFFMGRATTALRPFYPTYPARTFFREPCMPPFLRDWHNHFDNYGNFMPGYCGGLSLGNWLELDELLEEGINLDERPVLAFLIADDIQGLLHFAQDLGYEESDDGYLSKCDLCTHIRKYLISTDQDFPELSPRQFYEHLT